MKNLLDKNQLQMKVILLITYYIIKLLINQFTLKMWPGELSTQSSSLAQGIGLVTAVALVSHASWVIKAHIICVSLLINILAATLVECTHHSATAQGHWRERGSRPFPGAPFLLNYLCIFVSCFLSLRSFSGASRITREVVGVERDVRDGDSQIEKLES